MQQRNSSRHIPERFLRQLWKHQHFNSNELQTTDGRPIVILSEGDLNTDGGPDFVNARIRIGNILYRGAVELHQNFDEWDYHLHHLDPKYNGVILHVILHGNTSADQPVTKSKRLIPVLALERFLDSSYRSTWEAMIRDERAERLSTIKCYPVNDRIDGLVIKKWLEKLAVERIELKVRRYEERLKELIDRRQLTLNEPPTTYDEIPFGINPEDLPPPTYSYSRKDFGRFELWRQLLYEGIMEALGYSKNQQAFLSLARAVPLEFFTDVINTPDPEKGLIQYEAILFGVAGLFPLTKNMSDVQGKKRVRQLKSLWKSYRTTYHGKILSEAEWQFFRLRPENFPTIRLAGAARLIPQMIKKDFFKSIIQTVKSVELSGREKFYSLEQLFFVPAEDFWSTHFLFEEGATHEIKTLVGKSRADDIILNVVIPISLLYARIFKDKDVRIGTLKLFEQSPPLSENTITRTIGRQLVKGKFKIGSAMLQQGALQLYKFYCIEKRCNECAIGKLVF